MVIHLEVFSLRKYSEIQQRFMNKDFYYNIIANGILIMVKKIGMT